MNISPVKTKNNVCGFDGWLCAAVTCFLLIGCSPTPTLHVEPLPEKYQYSNLPEPDIALDIPGLSHCDNSANQSLRLNSQQPVTLLVHGCYGSAGNFRTLSKVLAFHGQQTACFSYDDRDSMFLSSRQLLTALEELSSKLSQPKITLIGHSQGGLIARKALILEREDRIETDAHLELVTVSSPFSGIRAAGACGNTLVRVLSLGLNDLLCKMLSGDKWHEITSASNFIKKPGTLHDSVDRYLLITTDETDSCRRYDKDGICIEDDYVFGLDEQELPAVSTGVRPSEVEIKAGHVEIVGERGVVPVKLINALQQQGYMPETEVSSVIEFEALLANWYGVVANRTLNTPGPGDDGSTAHRRPGVFQPRSIQYLISPEETPNKLKWMAIFGDRETRISN